MAAVVGWPCTVMLPLTLRPLTLPASTSSSVLLPADQVRDQGAGFHVGRQSEGLMLEQHDQHTNTMLSCMIKFDAKAGCLQQAYRQTIPQDCATKGRCIKMYIYI